MVASIPWSDLLGRRRRTRENKPKAPAPAIDSAAPTLVCEPHVRQHQVISQGSLDKLREMETAVRAMRSQVAGVIDGSEETIVADICAEYCVSRVEIMGRGRPERIAHARQMLMAILVELGFTSVQVGRYLRRDHGTVLHGARAVADRIASHPRDRERWERLLAGAKALPKPSLE